MDDSVSLTAIGCDLRLAEVYDGIEFTELRFDETPAASEPRTD